MNTPCYKLNNEMSDFQYLKISHSLIHRLWSSVGVYCSLIFPLLSEWWFQAKTVGYRRKKRWMMLIPYSNFGDIRPCICYLHALLALTLVVPSKAKFVLLKQTNQTKPKKHSSMLNSSKIRLQKREEFHSRNKIFYRMLTLCLP